MRILSLAAGGLAATGLIVAGAMAAPQPAKRAQTRPAGRVQPPPPVTITPRRTATMATPRNLGLVGVTRIGNRSQAWLVDRNTQMRATVAPGQTAFGYRVKEIDGERVVLTQNGRQFALSLGENPEPQSLVAGYQSEMRSNTANPGSSSTPPTLEGATVPAAVPQSSAPAGGNTTIIEVNPVSEVRQVPAPPTGGAAMVNPYFDPELAGATFYPGLGTAYPGYWPPSPEAILYPGPAYGAPAVIEPYTGMPYAVNPYPAAPYPQALFGAAPYASPIPMDRGFYPGEGIVRGRYSGNFPGWGPWAPPYPSGQPRGVYSSDWPQDLRFLPLQRGNPQTFRRRSGDYGEGYSNNPQTRRRRDYYGR